MHRLLWPLLLLALSTAHAENILGKTTPFSKSQACRQVKCKLLSETKVGPYVVYTYTGKTEHTEERGRYFAIKKQEKNVAVGIYYHYLGTGGPDGYDDGSKFVPLEARRLTGLLGLKLPAAQELKWGLNLKVGPDILLTDRNSLSGKASNPQDNQPLSFVYAVQKAEAGAVAALLNRSDRPAKDRVIAQLKKKLGAVGNCDAKRGYRNAAGQVIKLNAQRFGLLEQWAKNAEKGGLTVTSVTDVYSFTAPGLSSSAITLLFNPFFPKAAAEYGEEICFL